MQTLNTAKPGLGQRRTLEEIKLPGVVGAHLRMYCEARFLGEGGPTTTPTILEFILRGPVFASDVLSSHKCDFDATSDAKRDFENHSCGCVWAVPEPLRIPLLFLTTTTLVLYPVTARPTADHFLAHQA